ncbi:MAG: MarR family winged helix-turn-helix transcriptional regulator [Chloroflexota bacterium]
MNESRLWTDADAALGRLMELALLLNKDMAQGLAEYGLTVARAHVLWEVHHRGSMTQRELSQILDVSARNVTGLVDALEADGFVARTPHPTDRRATLVTLAERGRDAAARMGAEEKEFALQLFDHVPDAELTGFIATLDGVIERLRAVVAASVGQSHMRRERTTRV